MSGENCAVESRRLAAGVELVSVGGDRRELAWRVCLWLSLAVLLADVGAMRRLERTPPPVVVAAMPVVADPAALDTVVAPVIEVPTPPETTEELADPPVEEVAVTAPPPRSVDLPGEATAARAAPRSGTPPVTGRIDIPKIGLSHTTYEGNTLAEIDHGPSHWPGTAMPGQPGNTVFPGHRVTHSRPFYWIDQLTSGDQVIFTTSSGRFVYEVTKAFVVDPDDVWIIKQTADPTFTIFACHPRGSAAQRYVVQGRLAGAPATRPPPTTTTTQPPRSSCLLCLG